MEYQEWWKEVNAITKEEWRLHINPENSPAKRLFEADIGIVEAANYLNLNFAQNHERFLVNLLDKIKSGSYLWGDLDHAK